MTHEAVSLYAIILAGGSGTRLWPLSRNLRPKHLLPSLGGEKSLLQQTAIRLLKVIAPERILVVTHEDHRFEVLRQLQEVTASSPEGILAEPIANNTLPAISWAVMQIAAKDPEAVVGVFPSDHLITDEKAFQGAFEKAVKVASQGYLVTFGIPVTGPETGYGYIQIDSALDHSGDPSGAFRALSFVEKPDRETALSYMKKGNYYWNSGMFVFRIADFQAELRKQEPEIEKATAQIVASGNDPSRLKALYPTLKKISIDHGIMEKAERIAVVPSNFGWSDLGSWEAVYHLYSGGDTALPPNPSSVQPDIGSFAPFDRPDQVRSGQYSLTLDEAKNVVQGDVIAHDTKDSLLISTKGVMGAIGLRNMVVIQTDDAVLVGPRDRVQEVKQIVERLKDRKPGLAEAHTTVTRPWGTYAVLEEGPGYKIKKIVVEPGQKLSLQWHDHRAEHWVVIEGTAKVTCGDKVLEMKPNESTFIPQGERHRLENPGNDPLIIIEVQTGSY